jgi:hypothetical protein
MTIIKQILQYLLGAYLLFMCLGYLIIGDKSIIGALISFISALLIMPITRNLIEHKLNLKFNRVIKYSLPFIGFFAPFFFIDYDKIANSSNTKNQLASDSIQGSIDSIQLDSSNKIVEKSKILPLAVMQTTKGKIAESPTIKPKKQKKYSAESKTEYKTTKRKKAKQLKSKRSESYQSSSGLCGHANKTGGYCKRRVRGGGYCWQHS